MLDSSNSVFIPSKFLKGILVISAIVMLIGGGYVYHLYQHALTHDKDVLTPLATIIQSLLTAITIIVILFLFQASKQHRYLEKATSTFMQKTLPDQIRKHFQRYQAPFGELTGNLPQPATASPSSESRISGKHQVRVRHVPGSLLADYLFIREKGEDDVDMALQFYLQINIRTIFFGIFCDRKDFGSYEADGKTDFVFDEHSRNFSEETQETLKNATAIQAFFAESARIAWRTIGWQCSLYEEGERATFTATTRLSDYFLHDPSEQLFIANDIASMVRGIADGIHQHRKR